MKTVAIVAISAGISVVAVIGVLIGIGAYQQAQQQAQLEKETEALIGLIEKVAEEQEQSQTIQEEIFQSFDCSGSARCYTGHVTQIIDGDTIRVGGQSIRFALSSTPEMNQLGGVEARNFIESVCPVGSQVLVDEDDGQTQGSYGRIIAVIYCNGMNLNEAVLEAGHAWLSSGFCSRSEFSIHAWAQKHGCTTQIQDVKPPEIITEPTQSKENNCDPSYPTVCIPPWPPDLDCGEIQYSNFNVLQPDPHRFDGDKDGIGCET